MNNLYDQLNLPNKYRYLISKNLLTAFAILVSLTSYLVGLNFAAVFSILLFCDYWITLEKLKDFYGIKRNLRFDYV